MNQERGMEPSAGRPANEGGRGPMEVLGFRGSGLPVEGMSPPELATQLEIHRVELEMQNQQLREMQAHLERARHRYFTLFDVSPVGYFVVNRAAGVLELNLRAAEMAGVDRSRLLSRSLLHHICTERLAAFDAFLEAVFAEERSQRVEVALVVANGSIVSPHVQMDGLKLPSPDGEEACCLLVCTDVSERKRAEEARLRLERQVLEGQRLESIGLLAGGVAHDFNNLLTGILGNLGVLQDEAAGDVRSQEPLLQAIQCARRAADLCQQMLAYAGRARFEAQTVDLNGVCRDTAALVRSNYASRARLDLELAEALPAVVGDATQLGQVVLNLLINAFESIDQPSGRVLVRTGVGEVDGAESGVTEVPEGGMAPAGCHVFLEVIDTGCGMTREVRERVFEPFFSTKFAGRGLGLAASAGIVRAHRGEFHVSSRPQEGSTFRLYLPASQEVVAERVLEGADGRATWDGNEISGCVLVVDDEEPVRTVVARTLSRVGLRVVEAVDGEAALKWLDEGGAKPDVVLMDLTMPGMAATELLSRIRRQVPGVPVVVMSGFCEEDVLRRLEGRRTEGFLSKPFLSSGLREKMVQVIAAARRSASS